MSNEFTLHEWGIHHVILWQSAAGNIEICVSNLRSTLGLTLFSAMACCNGALLNPCGCSTKAATPLKQNSISFLSKEVEESEYLPSLMMSWLAGVSVFPNPNSYEWIVFANEVRNGILSLCDQVKEKVSNG